MIPMRLFKVQIGILKLFFNSLPCLYNLHQQKEKKNPLTLSQSFSSRLVNTRLIPLDPIFFFSALDLLPFLVSPPHLTLYTLHEAMAIVSAESLLALLRRPSYIDPEEPIVELVAHGNGISKWSRDKN